jgi:hypothetical protein
VKGRWWAAISVVVLVVGVAVFMVARESDDDVPTPVSLGTSTGGVTRVPGFPGRMSPATTIIDGRLFVFGGSPSRSTRFRNDGILVAQDFSTVTHLPPAPFDPPLYSPHAIPVGSDVVVYGTACGPNPGDEDGADPVCRPGTTLAAAFDTTTMEWRRIEVPRRFRPQSSGRPAALGATSDGRVIFQHGILEEAELWSFDLSSDRWSRLESPPVRIDQACMSGDTLVVQSASYRNNGTILEQDPARLGSSSGYLGDGYVLPTIASRDLTEDTPWVKGPPGAEITFISGSPTVVCTGDSVFVHDGAFVGLSLAYSLSSKRWTDPPAPPLSGYFGSAVWTGSELVLAGTTLNGPPPTMAYSPSTNSWRVLEGVTQPERGLLWNGNAIVGYAETLPQVPQAELRPSGVFRYVPTPE